MASVYNIPVKTIQGENITLNQYEGKVLLLVNVASKCGLTPQYEGLEKLYTEKKNAGLEILGFPANNFLAQEPGSDEEIQEFCSVNYKVDFPLFSKISVAGEDKHPLYQTLTQAIPERIGSPRMQILAMSKFLRIYKNCRVLVWLFQRKQSICILLRWNQNLAV